MSQLTRRQHQELIDKLKLFAEEQAKLKSVYSELRTRLGTNQEQGTNEFFIIVEAIIDLASAIITQCQNQITQADVCIDYADGFESRYKDILSMVDSLNGLLDQTIKRIEALESVHKNKAIVEKFFDSKFAKISKYIGWAGVVMTVASYWSNIKGG
jgi:hypothetical protein